MPGPTSANRICRDECRSESFEEQMRKIDCLLIRLQEREDPLSRLKFQRLASSGSEYMHIIANSNFSDSPIQFSTPSRATSCSSAREERQRTNPAKSIVDCNEFLKKGHNKKSEYMEEEGDAHALKSSLKKYASTGCKDREPRHVRFENENVDDAVTDADCRQVTHDASPLKPICRVKGRSVCPSSIKKLVKSVAKILRLQRPILLQGCKELPSFKDLEN